MLTHNHSRGFSATNGRTFSGTASATAGGEIVREEPIPLGSTNLAFAFAAVAAKTKALWMKSDKALTIKTNSSGSPANTFTLVANVPFSWVTGGDSCRDTGGTALADITSLFITNGTGVDATLQIAALVDPT